MTELTIYGTDFVFVTCGEKSGREDVFIGWAANDFYKADDIIYNCGELYDISFLEHCKNATSIEISYNEITYIPIFKNLNKLTDLTLTYN